MGDTEAEKNRRLARLPPGVRVEVSEQDGIVESIEILIFARNRLGREERVTSLYARIDRSKRRLFVHDIRSAVENRRRGYGTAALVALVDYAARHGFLMVEGELSGVDWDRREAHVSFYTGLGGTIELDEGRQAGRIRMELGPKQD